MRVFYPGWMRDELIPLLEARLSEPARSRSRAVLFGSSAQGRATAFSNVDLFLL
ncbi:hypothetical protein [Thermus sp.]|uniref:hypothetical protein n=1 Tax=Thermus sp. TaxID=275 RepID=UPI00331F9765